MFLVILLTACLYKKSDIPVNNGPWVRVYVFLENKSILKYLGSPCSPADNGMSNSFSTSVHAFPKVLNSVSRVIVR